MKHIAATLLLISSLAHAGATSTPTPTAKVSVVAKATPIPKDPDGVVYYVGEVVYLWNDFLGVVKGRSGTITAISEVVTIQFSDTSTLKIDSWAAFAVLKIKP